MQIFTLCPKNAKFLVFIPLRDGTVTWKTTSSNEFETKASFSPCKGPSAFCGCDLGCPAAVCGTGTGSDAGGLLDATTAPAPAASATAATAATRGGVVVVRAATAAWAAFSIAIAACMADVGHPGTRLKKGWTKNCSNGIRSLAFRLRRRIKRSRSSCDVADGIAGVN